MKHQRGRLDNRQYVPNVQVIIEPHQRANRTGTGGGAFPASGFLAGSFVAPYAGSIEFEQNALAPMGLPIAYVALPNFARYRPGRIPERGESAIQHER